MISEPVYELVLPESNRLLAESETLAGILTAAATIRQEQNIDGAVILKAGTYDAAATLLAVEGLAV